jgi:membrane-associated phospholipid phosphatase
MDEGERFVCSDGGVEIEEEREERGVVVVIPTRRRLLLGVIGWGVGVLAALCVVGLGGNWPVRIIGAGLVLFFAVVLALRLKELLDSGQWRRRDECEM